MMYDYNFNLEILYLLQILSLGNYYSALFFEPNYDSTLCCCCVNL
jgi:hypothetical protein